MEELETPTGASNGGATTIPDGGSTINGLELANNGETISSGEPSMFYYDIDSTCSTPYVSAPSSPGRGPPFLGFYYSAPASPVHFVLSTSSVSSMAPVCAETTKSSMATSLDFEFSARVPEHGKESTGSMSSAEELFLNGKIRPMKLSTHLQRPQVLAPLPDLDEIVDGERDDGGGGNHQEKCVVRGRDLNLRNRSLRRRTRSMSPLRTNSFQWHEDDDVDEMISTELNAAKPDVDGGQNDAVSNETTPSASGSSSRSSSVGRSSKRWIFLKEFLYRSKSEGRNNGHKFWPSLSLSFSPIKDKKLPIPPQSPSNSTISKEQKTESPAEESGNAKQEAKNAKHNVKETNKKKPANKKTGNSAGKRRVPPSPHELHYTANRAQAEEMRRKTYLPYKQGLLGCLGFSSKSYGAMNGIARAMNPVYSR